MPQTRKTSYVNQNPVPITYVRVKNTSTEHTFKLPFDGDIYTFEPGEEMEVKYTAYCHWCGFPHKDAKDKQLDQQRLRSRWGHLAGKGCGVPIWPFPFEIVEHVVTGENLVVGGLVMPPIDGETTVITPTAAAADKDALTAKDARIAELEAQLAVKDPEPVKAPPPAVAPAETLPPGPLEPPSPEPVPQTQGDEPKSMGDLLNEELGNDPVPEPEVKHKKKR